MRSFTLEITYSQVAVFNHQMDRPFNNWTEEHFDQGFVWRPRSVSFRTSVRHGNATVQVLTPEKRELRPDATVAIAVPFEVASDTIEVAGVFKGELVEGIAPGSYELLFAMGGDVGEVWCEFQFIKGKVAGATIVKPHPMLKIPRALIMTAEPA